MRLRLLVALSVPSLFACTGLLAPAEGSSNVAECADTLDNDGDGSTDCEDPDCDVLVACANLDTAGGDADTDSDSDSDSDSDADSDPVFDVAWGDLGLTFSVDGESGTFNLGIAETAASEDPWTGEDCLNGYSLGNGDVLLYCHDDLSDGDTLAYNGSPVDLDESRETVFSGDQFESRVTYYVYSNASGDCFTWGDDPSYYAGLGCTKQ
jgi:hypothetical protein